MKTKPQTARWALMTVVASVAASIAAPGVVGYDNPPDGTPGTSPVVTKVLAICFVPGDVATVDERLNSILDLGSGIQVIIDDQYGADGVFQFLTGSETTHEWQYLVLTGVVTQAKSCNTGYESGPPA